MNAIEKINDPVAVQLSAALTSAFRGEAFPSIDDPQSARTLLALAAACEDEATIKTIGGVAVALLAQRARLSIQAQHEQANQLRAKASIQ
jgi:hypothetical protein